MENNFDAEELKKVLKSYLKIEEQLHSVRKLCTDERFSSRINYEPHYQRSYVWSRDKASYLIDVTLFFLVH